MKSIIAGMVALAALASAATDAQAQSFNCRRAAFPDEKLICMSPELSRLDERLDRVFRQNMRLLSPAGRQALDREEEQWVIARRRCGPDHDCIEGFYRSRIDELSERLGEYRDGPPPAFRERLRDVAPPERRAPEPSRAEPRGERPSREPPAAASRAPPEEIKRSTRREPPDSPARRPSARGEGTSRAEQAAEPRVSPPAAPEKRQPAPARAGPETPRGATTAGTGRESPRRPAPPEAPAAARSEPASGGGARVPRIEFADPVRDPMSPAR